MLKLMGKKIFTILRSQFFYIKIYVLCACLFRLYSRSVSGNVVADVTTSQGINLWRYQAPNSYLANATENPYNIGFCTPQTKCLGAGIYNATVCQQGRWTILDLFDKL